MKQTMGDRILELESQLRIATKELETAQKRVMDLESGDALVAMTGRRERMIQFARECIRWGATTCRCGEAAELALLDIGEAL